VKLLYFSRDYTTHDHRFLSALAKTEHKVFFLRLERRGHQLEDRSLPPEIEQIRWAGGQAPARFKDGPRLLSDLRRVIREVQPDLIQAGPLQRSAFLVALTGFRRGRKSIPLLSMSWGYDLIFDADKNAFWRWATRYTLKRSVMMLGDCHTIRQLAVSHGMPDERIVTFPWGVDLKQFRPQEHSDQGKQSFTLLSTRGWEPIYGVDVIARAFVQAAHQAPNLRLVMLGNGSQASLLRQIFLNAGTTQQVVFPGQVSQTDLPHYYQSADLYMSASHSDGTSISLLEAMACGVPALVSDIPGNQEWVTHGENGWIFPDGDAQALTETILQAVENRSHLHNMGAIARELTEQRADWTKNFQKLLQTYGKVINMA